MSNNMHCVAMIILLAFISQLNNVFSTITLNHISTVYVPNGHDPVTFGYNVEACEQSAVDDQQPYVYAVGKYNYNN